MSYGTRTSHFWQSAPGAADVLNLRHVFKSSSPHGIPDLAPTGTVPTELAAWTVPRQREHAAENGGAVHFFLDDYRFEAAWTSPERTLERVLRVGVALTPDFSLWRDMPLAAQVYQRYRSMWLGAFWQARGVDVIPTACWSTEESYGFAFDGIPRESVVAVSAVGVRADPVDRRLFRAGVEQLLGVVKPAVLLSYGPLKHCDGLDLPRVVVYQTFWGS